MSYLDFFNFQSEPFSTAPDTRFYFDSKQHSQAMLRLEHAISNMKGLAVIVGDVGTGKTMLARRLLDSLPEDQYESALLIIIHSKISTNWFLKKIAMQFGIDEISEDPIELLGNISRRLMEIHDEGKKAVVLVDEAQMLNDKSIMEELRGLLNIEIEGKKLLSIVLFGLPELNDVLQLDPPLAQRMALKYRLRAFDLESTKQYILHRLRMAGAQGEEVFTDGSIQLIHKYSKGIPRLINTICDNALFEAFLLKKKTVGEDIIANVSQDLGLLNGKEETATENNRDAVESQDTEDFTLDQTGGNTRKDTEQRVASSEIEAPATEIDESSIDDIIDKLDEV